MPDKIISIARVTERELAPISARLKQLFPAVDDDVFTELLRELDGISSKPKWDGFARDKHPKP